MPLLVSFHDWTVLFYGSIHCGRLPGTVRSLTSLSTYFYYRSAISSLVQVVVVPSYVKEGAESDELLHLRGIFSSY